MNSSQGRQESHRPVQADPDALVLGQEPHLLVLFLIPDAGQVSVGLPAVHLSIRPAQLLRHEHERPIGSSSPY